MSTQKYFTKSVAETFNASSTVDNSQIEAWGPKKMNPQNPILPSSKRKFDTSDFAEKEKRLASKKEAQLHPL
jgi:hypothetical protein